METHYPYSRYLQETFGSKTYKIVVSSGLTCPTRDGIISEGGCAFCDIRGSSSYFGKKGKRLSVQDQILKKIPEVQARFQATRFLAYFQSYTNTYSDLDYLTKIYTEALSIPEISGLCIGTRPDCMPDEVLDLLERIAKEHYVSLELGVQSFEDSSLEWLKRGHSAQCSIDALQRLAKRAPHVHTCVHLMFGAPSETSETPITAAQILSHPNLNVRGVKLHQLMVLKNTELAARYENSPFQTLSLTDYSEVVYRFITHLSPKIYIERLYATATHHDECIAPLWSCERWRPHNEMRRFLEEKNCRQGSHYQANFIPSLN